MKQRLLWLMLVVCSLALCWNEGSVVVQAASGALVRQENPQIKVKKLTKEQLDELVGVEAADSKSLTVDKKLLMHSNGVEKLVGGSKVVHPFKEYKIPSNWQLAAQSIFPEKDVIYVRMEADGKSKDHILMYALQSYDRSPLDGGKQWTQEGLAKLMQHDHQRFQLNSEIKIGEHDWLVGYEESPANRLAKVTFYRMEETGSFEDSVMVVSYMFSIPRLENSRETIKGIMAEVKSVILSFSETKDE